MITDIIKIQMAKYIEANTEYVNVTVVEWEETHAVDSGCVCCGSSVDSEVTVWFTADGGRHPYYDYPGTLTDFIEEIEKA